MGASLVYLDKPNKDILHEEGEDGKLAYVASEMQGWRINMEDAHIANLKFAEKKAGSSKKYCLFGVFDGHGGREVAHYTKQHLEDLIMDNKHFENQEFGEALRQGFLDIDR